MSQLPVVDSPARQMVRKSLLQVGGVGPTNSYFDELTLINKELKVVPPPFHKHLGSEGSFEPTALFGSADKAILIKFEFDAGLLRVPGKQGWVKGNLRASNPSGGSIISCESSLIAIKQL